MKKCTLLVIAAHPDDETLGCGGTMARFAQEGNAVHVGFAVEGVDARGRMACRRSRKLSPPVGWHLPMPVLFSVGGGPLN